MSTSPQARRAAKQLMSYLDLLLKDGDLAALEQALEGMLRTIDQRTPLEVLAALRMTWRVHRQLPGKSWQALRAASVALFDAAGLDVERELAGLGLVARVSSRQ